MSSIAGAEEEADTAQTHAANREHFRSLIVDRQLHHAKLKQEEHMPREGSDRTPFCFVIGADTQLGMASVSQEWQTELDYCRRAISHINAMEPRPAFACMCGDLVDMMPDMFPSEGTREWRVETQIKQFQDFQSVWRQLSPDVPLVCVCGNHDVGNTPTTESIDTYKSFFGDDYFAFWCNGCYFICVNSNTYSDPSLVGDLFAQQHQWLEERLAYARASNARKIFLCGHHPWFLYSETETAADLPGMNVFTARGEEHRVPDAYFSIPLPVREQVLSLCKKYKVDACFSGHYHQNLVSRTSWGMPMIVTGAICNILLNSNAKDSSIAENQTPAAGVRVVVVDEAASEAGFTHEYEAIC